MKRRILSILASGAFIALPTFSQEHPLYTSGHFPSGQFYDETSIETLIGKAIPNPSYLVGRFVYLPSEEETEDLKFFTSFAPGLTNPTGISFGQVLIGVKFLNNAPALALGKVIVPTSNDPLTIKTVRRSKDGKHVWIETESWSAR